MPSTLSPAVWNELVKNDHMENYGDGYAHYYSKIWKVIHPASSRLVRIKMKRSLDAWWFRRPNVYLVHVPYPMNPDEFLSQCCVNGFLTHVSFSGNSNLKDAQIETLANCLCQTLKCLDLSDCVQVSNKAFSMLSKCTKLITLNASGWNPHEVYRDEDTESGYVWRDSSVFAWIAPLPSMRELTVVNYSRNESVLMEGKHPFEILASKCPNITKLVIGPYFAEGNSFNMEDAHAIVQLVRLKSFVLRHTYKMNSVITEFLKSHLPEGSSVVVA